MHDHGLAFGGINSQHFPSIWVFYRKHFDTSYIYFWPLNESFPKPMSLSLFDGAQEVFLRNLRIDHVLVYYFFGRKKWKGCLPAISKYHFFRHKSGFFGLKLTVPKRYTTSSTVFMLHCISDCFFPTSSVFWKLCATEKCAERFSFLTSNYWKFSRFCTSSVPFSCGLFVSRIISFDKVSNDKLLSLPKNVYRIFSV